MSIVEDAGPPVDPSHIRWAGYGLSAASAGAAALAWFEPGAATAALAIALPLPALALALAWPGVFEVTTRGRRSFNPLIGLGPLSLLLLAINVHLVDLTRPWEAAAAGAVVAAGAALVAIQRGQLAGPIGFALLMAVFGGLYAGSAFTVADQRFDSTPGAPFQADILGKYEHHGRSTSYSLTLGAWGPRAAGSSVDVPHDMYLAAQPGELACLTLHPGALGTAWYAVALCAGQAAPAPPDTVPGVPAATNAP